MTKIVKEMSRLITYIDKGNIIRVKAVSEGKLIAFIAEDQLATNVVGRDNITFNTIRFYTRPKHLKYPNINFIEKGYTVNLKADARKLGMRQSLIVRPNANNVLDLTPFSTMLMSRIGSREKRKEIFGLFLDDMENQYFSKVPKSDVNLVFLLSDHVPFRHSYVNTYLRGVESGLYGASNVFLAYQDITGELNVINVYKKEEGSADGVYAGDINFPRIRSIYKRYSNEVHRSGEMSDIIAIEEIDEDEEVVEKGIKNGSTLTPEEQVEVKEKIDSNVDIPEYAKSLVKKAVDKGMVSPEEVSPKSKKKLDEVYFKSLVSAISDTNTTNDLRTYDRKKFDKSLELMTKEKSVKEVIRESSPTSITPPKIDKTLKSKEPQTVQNVTSNTIRTQYREKLLDKDINAMMESLVKNPDMPLFLDRVTTAPVNDGLNIYDTKTYTFKDLDGKEQNVVINIPKLVEGKYYVLDGKRYVMYNQLVAKPVVKIKEDTVAITTSYNKTFIFRFGEKTTAGKTNRVLSALMRNKNLEKNVVRRENAKEELPYRFLNFDTAPIFQVIESITLGNGDVISYKSEDWLFEDRYQLERVGKMSNGNSLWVDRNGMMSYHVLGEKEPTKMNIGILDYIIQNIGVKIFNSNPKTVYSRINIVGRRLPLILVMMTHTSLLEIMKQYGTRYHIVPKDERIRESSDNIVLTFEDLRLVIETSTPAEQLLYNPLKGATRNTENVNLKDFLSVTSNPIIYRTLGQSAVNGVRNSLNNFLDPITIEQLEKDLLPTEIIELLLYTNSMLVDNRHNKVNDMNMYRIRNEETFAAMIYRHMSNEQNRVAPLYRRNRRSGKLSVNPNFLIQQMTTDLPNVAPLSSSNPYYEIDEINKVTYSGFLGLNSSRSATVDLRLPHESHKGTIDSNAITDNSKVGLIKYLPLNFNLTNLRGNIEPIQDKDFYEDHTRGMSMNMAVDVAIAAHSDSSRTAMGAIQSRHFNPINNFYSKPLLRTGVEDALAREFSSDWIIKSPVNGTITKVGNDHVIIDGKHRVNFGSKILRNSASGFYHEHSYTLDDRVKVGQKVEEGTPIAYNDGVFKDGVPTLVGRYLRVCLAPRSDLMEDASILSSEIANEAVMKYVSDKEVVVNPEEVIKNVVRIGDTIGVGDVLLETERKSDIEEFKNSPLFDELSDMTNKVIAKDAGVVSDIKFYSNRETFNDVESGLISDLNRITKTDDPTEERVFLLPGKDRIQGRKMLDSIIVHIFITKHVRGESGSKVTMSAAKSIYSVKDKSLMPKTIDGDDIDLLMSSFSLTTRMTPVYK